MKKLLAIIVLGLLLNGCSQKPQTAFQCFDPQTNKRIFSVIYNYPWSRVYSPTDLRNDGLSNFNQDFWEMYNAPQIKSGTIIEFFEDLNLNRATKSFTIKAGKNKGTTFELPLTNYRNIYFNTKTKVYEIYEYYHPTRVSLDNLKVKKDNYGLKINITFKKRYECKEDKELYKALKATGHAMRD